MAQNALKHWQSAGQKESKRAIECLMLKVPRTRYVHQVWQERLASPPRQHVQTCLLHNKQWENEDILLQAEWKRERYKKWMPLSPLSMAFAHLKYFICSENSLLRHLAWQCWLHIFQYHKTVQLCNFSSMATLATFVLYKAWPNSHPFTITVLRTLHQHTLHRHPWLLGV